MTPWRHTIHLWSDGFTVEDGLLQGYEVASNARLGAELQLDPLTLPLALALALALALP